MWEWILKGRDIDRRNTKLDQTEFIDMDALSGDPELNMEVQTVKHAVKYLFDWLAETFVFADILFVV